ncbi:MAG: AAA family ATPase [Chloroflexota bacterium]|nr:AAA family ATPase [Chloroflexota bacterium]
MPQARTAPAFDRREYELEITDNLEDLLAVLPPHLAEALTAIGPDLAAGGLIEIVMDLGRFPEARFQETEVDLAQREVSREDLAYVADRIGHFGEDNRAGIERTLHRISAIRNRSGDVVGLTCRIGRAVYGTIAIIRDLIESGQSVLLLGRPGVGKTTMLRETARVLADELSKRVVIVDTSNEIAGDGDIPHPGIGRARRMQVPTPAAQHAVMIEAVENHMPEVVVIDEIGTELEAMAARTIAERGVQLIGTAHGNSLENLMMNPTLSDLIGGIQSVTLSDEEARRRGTQKSILERKAPPTFGVMIEIASRDEVAVHTDVAATVDTILRGGAARTEVRRREDDGRVEVATVDPRRDPSARALPPRAEERSGIVDIATRQPAREIASAAAAEDVRSPAIEIPSFLPRGRGTESKPLRVYPFGVSRNRLEQAIAQLGVPAVVVREQREADLVVTLKNYYRRKPQPLREAEARGTPVYVLRANTGTQMENVLAGLFPKPAITARTEDHRSTAASPTSPGSAAERTSGEREDRVERAMFEAEEAIGSVIDGGPPVALAPQGTYVRRLQHEMADRYNLASRSRGRDPHRRVEIYRDGVQ